MRKDVKVMNGYELMRADVSMLNGFVDKCAPIWNPVFANEFQKKDFNIVEYTKEMSKVIDNLRYQMTLKKMDGYDIESEIRDFIEKEDLNRYQSNDLLVGCMYLMGMQQLIMESVLNKVDINNEMFIFNMVKGFIYSMKDFEIKNELDLSFVEIPETLKLTIESLLSEEDSKYVRF
jgi:hypothetical protein|uniref:Uncharacterized protein n=1 Tax=Myoviridae sp. ctkfK18 TaxID=2825165 RepID=A0A8S5VGI5_9CAUD|nr:MAG TPA: hypothetical protein [Myoviridae sp. ctkfK18]